MMMDDGKRKRSGKKKDKQIPKKSKMITGYIIYASEIRREIIKANPDKDFGDISKIVGIEWRKLGQEEKVLFEKRAEEQNSLFREEFSKMSELANEAIANAVAAAAAAGGVAPELDKLADVAAERAANEETQQQQQNQHQHESFINNHQQQQHQSAQQDGSFVSNTDSFMSNQEQSFISSHDQQQQQAHQQQQQAQALLQQQSQLRSPLPNMNQYANNVAANYSAAASYSQQSAYYSQLMMGQATPTLIRSHYANGSTNPNDILLQQQAQSAQQSITQQPFSIVQHSQPTTNVQYCNNPACCASGRYQPYPYPYSPPEPPVTPSSVPQQQQQAASLQSPIKLSPTHPQVAQQHLYKMNNIIYRKPSQVKLRPKDVGTQTDPIAWVGKFENESPKKQQLKFSKEFIQHMHRLGATPNKTTAECHW